MAIVLAMQIHLAAILVLVFTWKASDTRAKWLLVTLALPLPALLFGVPAVMLWIAQAVYIASVLVAGVVWKGLRA